MAEPQKHLYYMDELSDYKISDGYPDIRGWDVKDIDDRVIGKVDNLLVNKLAERVVYLDVEVDKSIIDARYDPYGRSNHSEVKEYVNKDGENHVIIPIGLVDLNTDSNYVYTDIIDHRTFAETKRFRKGDHIDRQYERQVMDSYRRKSEPYYGGQAENRSQAQEEGTNISETRLREIIREEIVKYHQTHNSGDTHYTSSGEIVDAEIIPDEETKLRKERQGELPQDDEHFYERREFENKGFRRRTPGI